MEEFQNTLLRSLGTEIRRRLCLRPVKFELKHEIEYPGKNIDQLYFVEEGMASMTTTFTDGSQVEVGMFGYESVIGVSALMGTKRSLNRVYTQIAGHGYACGVEPARREFERGEDFQHLALRYVQTQLVHGNSVRRLPCEAQCGTKISPLVADLRRPSAQPSFQDVAGVSGRHAGGHSSYAVCDRGRIEASRPD